MGSVKPSRSLYPKVTEKLWASMAPIRLNGEELGKLDHGEEYADPDKVPQFVLNHVGQG